MTTKNVLNNLVPITPSQSRDARSAIGISQRKFADKCGISRAYLSGWENQKHILEASALMKIKRAYEDEGYLFSDNEAIDNVDDEVIEGELVLTERINSVPPVRVLNEKLEVGHLGGNPKSLFKSKAAMFDYIWNEVGYRPLDNYLVANGISTEEVESVLDEIRVNDSIIDELSSMTAMSMAYEYRSTNPRKMFGVSDQELIDAGQARKISLSRHVTSLMARNYALVTSLKGSVIVDLYGDADHLISGDRPLSDDNSMKVVIGSMIDESKKKLDGLALDHSYGLVAAVATM